VTVEDASETLKRGLPVLLRTDPDLRRYILDLTHREYAGRQQPEDRFDRILEELRQDREAQERKWAKQDRKWEEQDRKWEQAQEENRREWEESRIESRQVHKETVAQLQKHGPPHQCHGCTLGHAIGGVFPQRFGRDPGKELRYRSTQRQRIRRARSAKRVFTNGAMIARLIA